MTPDPFVHLPHLRDKITPPEQSQLRVTPEVMAFWDERARKLGRPADWRLPDAEIEASLRFVLGRRLDAGEDMWVFAYGSLMWDPGFHFAEVRLADLERYQRRFSFLSRIGRGSPEQPGLMLSIERCAGRCHGLVYRIAAPSAAVECSVVWRREMLRASYRPSFQPIRTPQGEITALVFTPNLAHADHVGELPLEQTASIIANGVGVMGTNRQYLEQLRLQLERLGVEDPYVRQLLQRVQLVAGVAGVADA